MTSSDKVNQILVPVPRVMTLSELLDYWNISGRKRREFFKRRHILVNGSYETRSYKVEPRDEVAIFLPDEDLDYEASGELPTILYESHHILVIDKPAGQVMYWQDGRKDALANDVSTYFQSQGMRRKIRFVNRLDMETSGIVVVAKHDLAHSMLAGKWDHGVAKYYIALAPILEGESGVFTGGIKYDELGKRYIVAEDGKASQTSWRMKDKRKGFGVYEVRLDTGRTHQIRVHFSHHKIPILGDPLYMGDSYPRLALHAYKISLPEILGEEKVVIESELPFKDFEL